MKKYRLLIPLGLALAAAALVLFGLYKQITIQIDGQGRAFNTLALTVGDALRAANVAVGPQDRLDSPASAWLASRAVIRIERARPVSSAVNGIPLSITSTERLPELLLAKLGVPFTPQDQIYLDGLRVLPGQPLPPADRYTLQVRPAVSIALDENGQKHTFFSSAATLGQALWEAGVHLHPGDRLSPPADTPLDQPIQASLRRAVPLTIQLKDSQIHTQTAASTVGEALADAGVTLQGMDSVQPPEDQPLPTGGTVRVVRVREEIVLQETVVPFANEYQPDAQTPLDNRRIIQAGQYGLKVARERVRYEDGQEVSRQSDTEWVASAPKTQIVGLGTKAVVQKLDTPDGTIEYYRAVTVYATSYSPCNQGMGRCSRSTASGMLLKKGIIAVTLPWYRQFAGQRVYVPGYGVGVIADTGGGIPGTPWIDLGFSEEDYTAWHQNVTLYFLTPVPANVPWKMP